MTKGNPTNTPSIDDRELIERLRERYARWQESCGRWIDSTRANGREVTEEQERIMRADPDGKCADRFESLLSEIDKLEEALSKISELPGEINPGNYDHDDACNLNRQFCYAITIARTALNRTANNG